MRDIEEERRSLKLIKEDIKDVKEDEEEEGL